MNEVISKGPHKNLPTFHHAQNYNGYFPKNDIGNLNNSKAKYLYGRISQEEGVNRWFAQIKEVIDIF